jgi:hypothetical protein
LTGRPVYVLCAPHIFLLDWKIELKLKMMGNLRPVTQLLWKNMKLLHRAAYFSKFLISLDKEAAVHKPQLLQNSLAI